MYDWICDFERLSNQKVLYRKKCHARSRNGEKERESMSESIFHMVEIKKLKMKNRIYVTPMVTRFSVPNTGEVAPETVAHYQQLAKGSPGLIIQEATCVDIDGRLMDRQLGIWNDEQIQGLHQIVEAVHGEGCAIFVQLHHAGVVGISEAPMCPDDYTYVQADGSVKIGRRMTLEEIRQTQEAFVAAAVRAYQAGYDGVELHGCHQYLICQFLNCKVNQRQDVYGKDPLRFVEEILVGIRKEVPDDFIVGIRLGGFEPTLDAAIEHAKRLAQMGMDFIDVSYGFQREQEVFSPENYPFLDIIYAAERIQQAVEVPVFAANGITSPEMADQVMKQTHAAMIGIGRGFIVNPNWMADAIRGENTGKCLHCLKCRLYDDPEKCPGKMLFDRQRQENHA